MLFLVPMLLYGKINQPENDGRLTAIKQLQTIQRMSYSSMGEIICEAVTKTKLNSSFDVNSR